MRFHTTLVIISALLLVTCGREKGSPPRSATKTKSAPTAQPTATATATAKPAPTPAADGTISIKGDNCKKTEVTPSRVEMAAADRSSTWLVSNECGHTITVQFGDYKRKRGNAKGYDDDRGGLFDAFRCSPSPTLKKDESARITCKVVDDGCRNYDYEFSVCVSFEQTKRKLDPEIRLMGREGDPKRACKKLASSTFCKQ